ncbi:low temperature requirement protein A [Okibacterium endophyticum]
MTYSTTRALRRMVPRRPDEAHRTASPLELFFDLVFVVAVAFSSQQLHHMETEDHLGEGVLAYLLVFFAIWWAWMNFTWFATSFDTDDWLYRVTTIAQMAGVLVLAAGTSAAMVEHDFTLATMGYVIMRLAMVSQWLRAAISHPDLRTTALRYAAGITVVQVGWLVRLTLPEEAGLVGFVFLALAEIAVPVWAEAHRTTPWNAHHIAERYGLFTIILLGESILASANAVVEAINEGEHIPDLLLISAAGLVIAAGMWWVYFAREQHHHIRTLRSTLTFGYFHYVIFAAAGAFSAGVEVTIDVATGHSELHTGAAATLTVPVALFILGMWVLTLRGALSGLANAVLLVGVAIVAVSSFASVPWSIALTALGVVVSVAATELSPRESAGWEAGSG